MRLFTIPLLIIVLSACATTQFQSPQPDIDRGEFLLQLAQWDAHMTVVAMTAQQKLKARLHWRQTPQGYTIKLRDFIGRTVAVIESDASGVMARTSNGQRYQGADADGLLADLTGLKLPINGLKYWLQSLADPQQRLELITESKNQLPQMIQQAGWTIHYGSYQYDEKVPMAKNISLDHEDIHLQVKIARWSLEGG
jgi:outer membrane lipoprotein LolB